MIASFPFLIDFSVCGMRLPSGLIQNTLIGDPAALVILTGMELTGAGADDTHTHPNKLYNNTAVMKPILLIGIYMGEVVTVMVFYILCYGRHQEWYDALSLSLCVQCV
mmetsp:Transcript_6245/g.9425  ORF Transcript_6245/g.9425 Transcript_6245/m.9425 type:complete len:108 (-) Transcript_6245:6-329(-)